MARKRKFPEDPTTFNPDRSSLLREYFIIEWWNYNVFQGGRSCTGARVEPAEKFGLGRKF